MQLGNLIKLIYRVTFIGIGTLCGATATVFMVFICGVSPSPWLAVLPILSGLLGELGYQKLERNLVEFLESINDSVSKKD